jgi:hypothetical protein
MHRNQHKNKFSGPSARNEKQAEMSKLVVTYVVRMM